MCFRALLALLVVALIAIVAAGGKNHGHSKGKKDGKEVRAKDAAKHSPEAKRAEFKEAYAKEHKKCNGK